MDPDGEDLLLRSRIRLTLAMLWGKTSMNFLWVTIILRCGPKGVFTIVPVGFFCCKNVVMLLSACLWLIFTLR